MNYKKYLIISVDEIDKLNILELCEDSLNNLRRSLDGKKVLVRWWSTDSACWYPTPEQVYLANSLDIDSYIPGTPLPPPDPEFIKNLESKEGPYSHEEILNILSGPEWTKDITQI